MKNATRFVVLAGVSFFATACGNSDDAATTSSSSVHLSYDLIHNGCDTGKKEFGSKSDYCAGLKDDGANNGCALEERRDLYQRDCGTDFPTNSTPEPVHDSPTPAPNPAPEPQPAPDPETPSVVKDLAAAGIQVVVERDNNFPRPGDVPFSERLASFWPRLAAVESAVIAHKAQFNVIHVADFADFSPAYQFAILSVDMSVDDLNFFLGAADRVAEYRRKNGVDLDFGVIGYDSGKNGSADIQAKLSFLEQNGIRVAGPVREIDLGTSTMYSLYDRKLTLNYDRYAQEFESLASVLTPSQPFFRLVDGLGIKVSSTDFNFASDGDSRATDFALATRALGQEKTALETLRRSAGLEEIALSPAADQTNYFPTLHRLSTPSQGTGLGTLHGVLGALADQSKLAAASHIEFDYGFEGLGDDFLTASQHLASVTDLVKTKAAVIKKIRFGEKSGFEYSVLTAGYADSAADLRRVVQNAK